MVMQKRRVAGRGGTAARNPTGCITVYRAPAIVNHCVAAKLIVVVGRTERPVGLVALGQTFVRRGQDERQGSPPPAQPALGVSGSHTSNRSSVLYSLITDRALRMLSAVSFADDLPVFGKPTGYSSVNAGRACCRRL